MAVRLREKTRPAFPKTFRRVVILPDGEELLVRRMVSEDIETVTELELLCFKDAWSEKHFRHEVENSRVSVPIVAEIKGEMVGYMISWFVEDEIHIANIAVSPLYRKRGIGECLLRTILEEGQKRGRVFAYLEVRVSNVAAIQLYKKFGFTAAGIRSRYYQNGEDALLMEKYLGQEQKS
ncbi:MAG: ribosomal protein S18-alanine N-acetyltransferase [Calditrichaeota bacterium]|nr:ribosomal protein S18-alanine N-acetyltransferase [Calditrichota bacterium]